MATARLNPDSQPGKHWRSIQTMMGHDAITEAQVLDERDNVIYVIFGNVPVPEDTQMERVYQEGTVEGVVTGLVGADDTMHLHMRDTFERDLKIVVRDETLARRILTRFRAGSIRLTVRGTWARTSTGWAPEASKCTASSFEALRMSPPPKSLKRSLVCPGGEGKTLGRPQALQGRAMDDVRERLEKGEPVASIARAHNTSRQTIMRIRDAMAPA